MQLKDQAAIVTGGASGLGAATARKLASLGARVAVCDLNAKLAESVAAEIKGTAVVCDVADAASAEAAVAAAAKAHGPARVLINCAGIGVAKRVVGKDGPMPLGDFEKVIKVNLIGSFNMLRLATAEMAKLEPLSTGERGVVISTASVAAYDGQIGQSAYSASKGGIVAMTLPIARELAQFGIRVLTIAPGLFLTPLLANLPQEAQDSLAAAIPFPRRLGHADEFASLALHMIDNPYLNGEVVPSMPRCAWRRARTIACSSTAGMCRSSGAIATPPTSCITRATSRCSTTRPRSCSRPPVSPSRTSSGSMAWSEYPWWTRGQNSTSPRRMVTGSRSKAGSRVSSDRASR